MTDRRLAGILVICVVISTIFTAFLSGEKDRGITVVENAHPDRIHRSREQGSYQFQVGLVSREDFEVLEIDHYCLSITDRNVSLRLEDADLDGMSESFPALSVIRRMCESLGGEPDMLDVNLVLDGEAVTFRMVDFTDPFLAFAPDQIRQFPYGTRAGLATSPNPAMAFGVLFDGAGDPILYCEGVRDFFMDKELLLSDLYVRRNDEVASYTSCREAPQPEGLRILDAPRGGRLIHSAVKRNERFEVGFTVNAAWVPTGISIIQMVRISGNMEETSVLFNLLD